MLGKKVRLRNAYVIKAERVEKDAEGNITTIFCTYDAETLSKIRRTVVGERRDPLGQCITRVAGRDSSGDRLFSVPNPGAAEDFPATINPESLVIKQGYAEPSPKA